jgi:hypothetical protein
VPVSVAANPPRPERSALYAGSLAGNTAPHDP